MAITSLMAAEGPELTGSVRSTAAGYKGLIMNNCPKPPSDQSPDAHSWHCERQ